MKTVPLHGKVAAGRVALVDDSDLELVSTYRWNVWEQKRSDGGINGPYATTPIYVKGSGFRTTLKMHTLITGYAETDHVNHNGLDNRRLNLRAATSSQNKGNYRPRGGTSAFKGVYRVRGRVNWYASIRVHGRSRHLGAFADEIVAALAYDAAAREIFGEFAYTNFPDRTE